MSDKLSVHIRSDQIEEAGQSFLAGRSGYQRSQRWVFSGVCKRWQAAPRRLGGTGDTGWVRCCLEHHKYPGGEM